LVFHSGIYTVANAVMRRYPRMRRLPSTGFVIRIGTVTGLALAEEMLDRDSYAGLKPFGPFTSFIDIGCNVGWFPCVLLEYGCCRNPVGLLIDADPKMVTEAAWHMKTNGIQGECLWGAVGVTAPPSGGTTTFHINPANTSSSLTPFGPDHPYPVKGRVQTIAVPALDAGAEWRKRFADRIVDVLKLDVEGAEFGFLRAEGSFLASSVRHLICEWHAWHGDLDDITGIVEPLGFTLVEICEQDDKGGVVIFRNSRLTAG
jgi:FkbM family methyltransferase